MVGPTDVVLIPGDISWAPLEKLGEVAIYGDTPEDLIAERAAGAEVLVINASPDGYNINKNAGSTHPEQLQAMVKASGAVMGVAFDGDADRCLAVDEDGNMVKRRSDHGHSGARQEERGQAQP